MGMHPSKSKTLLPVICGHRGQVINNHLIVAGGYRGVYSNATYRLNLGKEFQAKIIDLFRSSSVQLVYAPFHTI